MAKRTTALYLPALRQDIQSTVVWSENQFGPAAADRYGELIRKALRDLLESPVRLGAKARPALGANAYVYHLMYSRDRVSGERVKAPRHFILYRYADDRIEFARLLHDSRDLARHLPTDYRI